jgi:hypothetical protein
MELFATAGEWAGCLSCTVTAISGYAQMARRKGGWREGTAWTAPLAFTSAAVMFLVVFGTLALIPWLILALAPLALIAASAALAWAEIAKLKDAGTATAEVLGAFFALIRDALWNAREDLRDLGGRLRRTTPSGDAAAVPPAAAAPRSPRPAPAGGPPGWAVGSRARHVPPLTEDPYLGAHPYPADVAASLELDQVPVPPHWDRTAQVISDFDPEDDDDTQGHIAGEAAGVLTVAAAVENRAEHLALAVGLDPAIIEAHYDIAEGFAELATRYALLVRRDHLVMGDLRDYRDQGGVIPHDGRRYMDAGDPRPGGDQPA